MQARTLHLLEYPKVLQALAGFASSAPGKAACLAVAPADELAEQNRRAALLSQYLAFRAESPFAMSGFEDLTGLLAYARGSRNVLDIDGLFALRESLGLAQSAREALGLFKDRPWPELRSLAEEARWPELTWSGLRRCLGQDGRLRDEASPELWAARQEVRRINQLCTKRAKDFLHKEGLSAYMQDDFVTVSSDRFVLPLKANFKGRLQGIVHDYSQTGETCYFEPFFLVELNNELQDHKRAEREAERAVMAMLTGLVRQEIGQVSGVFGLLVSLDALEAQKTLAAALDGRPVFMDERPGFVLLEARHPLLALAGPAMPLDLRQEPDEHALIVSGGNAGGKTVCLKTLGLISVMAQAGLPVPVAAGSRLPCWRAVYAFLGDEQSLEEHLSTFTAQIHSLAGAWPRIGEGVLVILDEFGAGTDPAQGAALAQAVVDSLLERRARAVVATHFPALKVYGLSTPGVRSASVLFDPATKRPLYRLAYDQVGASQALDVAREHGLPAEIIARAERNLLMQGGDASAVLDRLNATAVAKEKELAEVRAERRRLQDEKSKLAERFAREKKAALDEVAAAARRIVRNWQEQRIGQQKARQELAELRRSLAEEAPADVVEASAEAAFAPESLEAGAAVRYLPWGRAGRVVDKDLRRRQAKLDLDGVSLWVDFAQLGPVDGPVPGTASGAAARAPAAPAGMRLARGPGKGAARPASGNTLGNTPGDGGLSLMLDLRGRRGDEAVSELERFLDQALLKGARGVEIVHGRGTGALRREVHEFLRHFPAVGSFRLASEEEGGDGKTLVELK